MQAVSDFSRGKVSGNILRLAMPMVVAQLVNVLYNIVDRMYIGHMPEDSVNALTGVGLTFPILLIVTAFANLFGTGGMPLFSMARGAAQHEDGDAQRRRAATVMNNTFLLLVITGVALTVLVLLVKEPFLYLFGASDATYPYADSYITIYMFGSVFVMISLGMNGFINAQGFANKGMLTVLIGAVLNIVLDPIFIFALDMGVSGAALATVISQLASALWVIRFLTGKKTLYKLDFKHMRLQAKLVWEIVSLGAAGFIMSFTTSAVQIVCNTMLAQFGGDLFVGVMTVINSIREVTYAPVSGITNAANPVMGFNYGAQEYRRVRGGDRVRQHRLRRLYGRRLAASDAVPAVFHRHLQRRPDARRGLRRFDVHLLFRLLHDVAADGRAGRGAVARPLQAGDFLLAAAQGHHRDPADADPAAHPGHRGQRRVSGRSDLELHRRRRVLHHDALHDLAGAQTKGKNCAGRVSPRSFCVL